MQVKENVIQASYFYRARTWFYYTKRTMTALQLAVFKGRYYVIMAPNRTLNVSAMS